MKKLSRWMIYVGCVGLALVGCQAKTPTPTSIMDELQEQPLEVSAPDLSGEQSSEVILLDWLREQPFEPAPPEWPQVITHGLPEDFEFDDPESRTHELPSGEVVQITRVVYRLSLGGLISAENTVEVHVVGCPSEESRSEFLGTTLGEAEDLEWSVEYVSGTQILRFYGDGTDGRILVSGPYLIWIVGNVEAWSPWVDTFAELYLTLTTSPIALNPLDWLREQPFEPAPAGWPQVVTSDLPENWLVMDPDFETVESPRGETIQYTAVEYRWPIGGGVRSENIVTVRIFGFQNAEARSEIINQLAGETYYEFDLEQIGDAQVLRFHGGGDDGRTWVSGPYLLAIFSDAYTRNPWVDMFTEFYLALYPAE